jgi:flagellar basal body-associated protein FliL
MSLRLIPLWLSFLALTSVAALGADQDEQKKPEHKTSQAKSYLSLEPIYTTIVGDDHAQGMLMVGIGLDVPDTALREVADRSMPVLRDAYVRNLMAFTATAVRTDAQPDVSLIADRLQKITDRALGKKGAKVLLAQVAIRVSR